MIKQIVGTKSTFSVSRDDWSGEIQLIGKFEVFQRSIHRLRFNVFWLPLSQAYIEKIVKLSMLLVTRWQLLINLAKFCPAILDCGAVKIILKTFNLSFTAKHTHNITLEIPSRCLPWIWMRLSPSHPN
jgi:hypothetical protein